MTTTFTEWKTDAIANGLAPIPFDFQAISADEVGVIRNGVTLYSGYTVALTGSGTGTIIPETNWGADPLVIYSRPDLKQLANFPRFGAWYPDQIVPPLDKLARTIIALQGQIDDINTPLPPIVIPRGVVYAENYGALGDGINNDTAAITSAANYVSSQGRGIVKLIPGRTYKIDQLIINVPDVVIDATGATVTSNSAELVAMITLAGARNKWIGGTILLTSGAENPWFFNITGVDCVLDNITMIKTPETGHYHFYVRHTADGFICRNCRMEGSNGVYHEASNALYLGNKFIGRSSGGDDGIAVKGINDNVRNVLIIGNYFENLASGVSCGSEIGVLGVNDPDYTRSVGQIAFIGNSLKNCYGFAYLKPGGVAPYDYRDGTVEDVIISNNTLIDETGVKFERGIAITPGRGGRVRRVYGRNNLIRARTAGGAGRLVGAEDIYLLDYAGGSAGAAATYIDVEIDYRDPYFGKRGGIRRLNFTSGGVTAIAPKTTVTGATSGATAVVGKVVLTSGSWAGGDAAGYFMLTTQTGNFVAENLDVGVTLNLATIAGDSVVVAISDPEYAQGHPVTHIVSVSRAGAVGAVSNINLNVRGSGSDEAGFFVGAGITSGAVQIEKMHLTDVNISTAAGQGRAYLLSDPDLTDGGYWSLSGNGPETAGAGRILHRFGYRRGCMVKLNADLAPVDMSAGHTVAWDGADTYDTEDSHDPAVNNTRIIPPIHARSVELGCTITFDGALTVGTDTTVVIRKNGTTSYPGTMQACYDAASGAPCWTISGGPVDILPDGTDYFEVVIFTPGDTTVGIVAARSNFWMKIVE